MKAISEDVDVLLDNTSSVVDVACWIAERLIYAKNPKAKALTKDPHVNVNSTSSQNMIQDSVDTEFAEGKTLEEFMLEKEEIEFQDIDRCKKVALPDKQDVERCTSPEMSMRIACKREECIEEEICDMSLPKSYNVEENVHNDEVQLETPKINVVEISALPREIKSEMPIEQIESKTMQNVSLVRVVSTQFHVVPSRKILGKIQKLHMRQRKVLGSKIVRRAKSTKLLKRKIPSICRPPPEPPDRQHGLNDKVGKEDYPKCTMPMKKELIIGPLQHPLSW